MQSLTVRATLEALAPITQFISDATAVAGLDEHTAWQVQLAVDEAATNIIQHGYPEDAPGAIELSWEIAGGALVVRLRDYGRRFNPDDVPPPDIQSPLEERQAGGLGLYLMGRLMDEVRFDFDDDRGNLLTMLKQLPPAPSDVTEIPLTGRLDAVTTTEAIQQARSALGEHAGKVLLDMSGVTFMSSSGLRALLLLRKDLLADGGELRLCALQPQVAEVFALTGFTHVFAIHATREDALSAFAQRKA